MIKSIRQSLKLLPMTAMALGLCTQITAAHAAAPLTPEQTQAVKTLIRSTLVENPEILEEAMEAVKAKRIADHEAAQKAMIAANTDALLHADDPYFGAEKPKVYVVEFFDYNCGYCRIAFPSIMDVVNSEKDTRIVFKELPVLGPESVKVSRLALASREQGKYSEFHTALMKSDSRLSEDIALDIAKDVGLDTDKLKKDAESEKVQDTLTRNQMLSGMLGIRGTPSFIVGDTLFPGKVTADVLKQAIAEARKSAGK